MPNGRMDIHAQRRLPMSTSSITLHCLAQFSGLQRECTVSGSSALGRYPTHSRHLDSLKAEQQACRIPKLMASLFYPLVSLSLAFLRVGGNFDLHLKFAVLHGLLEILKCEPCLWGPHLLKCSLHSHLDVVQSATIPSLTSLIVVSSIVGNRQPQQRAAYERDDPASCRSMSSKSSRVRTPSPSIS